MREIPGTVSKIFEGNLTYEVKRTKVNWLKAGFVPPSILNLPGGGGGGGGIVRDGT